MGDGRTYGLTVAVDRKSTRLNSSHTVIYTLSLHDALPISRRTLLESLASVCRAAASAKRGGYGRRANVWPDGGRRSEEHTSELQSHSDLHSFPTRRSSDLAPDSIRKSGKRLPCCCQCEAWGLWETGERMA